MSEPCRQCGTATEPGDRFCAHCGSTIAAGDAAPSASRQASPGAPRPLPPLPELSSSGRELVVEVEADRPHNQHHASLARFRVTSNVSGPATVTLHMRLYGQGRLVEQNEHEVQQSCQFDRRGDQFIFSFPFRALHPGEIPLQELRATMVCGEPPETTRFELPDQSLSIQVTDPNGASQAPGIVVSGGIHLDFSQLTEMYGSDIKDLLKLHAGGGGDPAAPRPRWQPIRLRPLGAVALPPEVRVALPGDVSLLLVRIAAGQFAMGSHEGEGRDDEQPVRQISIADDFYLGKFPVTQEQYQALMEDRPFAFPHNPQHPADNVSWEQAREFCRRLQQYVVQFADRLDAPTVAIEGVDLPSEAEWEYACRAGSTSRYFFGDDRKRLAEYGWFEKNAERTTQAVGQLKPNPWGLYDVYGNVWEWCRDRYAASNPGEEGHDPRGPRSGARRVLRGGSWSYYARDCRSARRHAADPRDATANYGFRVLIRASCA